MIRREILCGGRMVKEIDQIDMISAARPYHHYEDGRHIWLLDGQEVTPAEAEAFQFAWTAENPS